MTGPTGLINFFVLEASDYVEQLDSLLRDAGPGGPEAESFTRAARALRGSATMARRGGIAALAAAVERLGRALRERVLPWTPTMSDALAAAVADLRQLVRGARDYDAADEQRAQDRTSELLAFAPASMRAAAPTPIAAGSGTMFVVSGATDVAAALTAAASRPASHELHAEALRRLRGFRGVAALRDHVALAEALDAVERVARHVDRQDGPPTAAETAVLAAGARQLRRLAEDIRGGRPHDHRSAEAVAFAEALAQHESAPPATDGIVPVASLFFADDGPHVVREAAAPGTTAADRFRLECAAAAEHLRRTVGDARREVADGLARPATGNRVDADRAAAALQSAAATLVELARSYGHDALAGALDRAFLAIDPADPLALATADAVGSFLVAQRRPVDDLSRRIGDLAAGRILGSVVAVGYASVQAGAGAGVEPGAGAGSDDGADVTAAVPVPVPTPTPAPEPFPRPGRSPEPEPVPEPEPEPAPIPTPVPVPLPAASTDGAARPTGRDLHALLATSIAGFERMRTPADGDAAGADVAGSGSGEPRQATAAATVAVGTADPAAAADGDDDLMSVDFLLYRGRSALGRALELRDEIRRGGGPPDDDQLDELFDLLDLAASA